MYALYEKHSVEDGHRYLFKKQTSLFGRNSGYIPNLLKRQLSTSDSEPHAWRVTIAEALQRQGESDSTLVINLKPKAREENLSLYELIDVWGYSSSGWTPIMIYIRGLFVDEAPSQFNDRDFVRKTQEVNDPIFSMMYLSGTIKSGELSGRWTPPGPSSTNSVLLWPESFEYFSAEAKRIMESKK